MIIIANRWVYYTLTASQQSEAAFVETSQTFNILSLDVKFRDKVTHPAASKNVCTHSLLFLSQTLTVLSSDPDTMSRESGEKRAHRTQFMCSLREN